MQIIPAIDLLGGRCVRLQQGDYDRETVFDDDPVAVAGRWADQGASRLHLVDLDGAREGRPINAAVVAAITAAVDIPCQLGGGVRSESTIRELFDATGIDRVIIGTRALKDPDWFATMAAQFPGRLCLGLDARNSMVATEGWRSVSQTPAIELAAGCAALPLAAVIYTNIALDGMLTGIDPGTLDDLVELASLGFPLIASGGVATVADIHALAELVDRSTSLAGVIVGRALYEATLTLPDALAAAKNDK